MSSMNKVILIGHLGKDPETRTFPSGDMVANVTIATSEKWKDKVSGEMQEATEWHRVVFNGRTAEVAADYLRKGSLICVEGSLRTRKYTDQAGVEKYTTEIRADRMQMLGGRPDGGGQGGDGGGQQRQAPQQNQRQGDGNGNGQQRQAPAQNQQRQAPQGNVGYTSTNGGGQQRQPTAQNQQRPQNSGGGGGGGFADMDDDIPFIINTTLSEVAPSKSRRLNRCAF